MRRMFIAGALAVVALSGYFGVQYYKRASDPLVIGISQRGLGFHKNDQHNALLN